MGKPSLNRCPRLATPLIYHVVKIHFWVYLEQNEPNWGKRRWPNVVVENFISFSPGSLRGVTVIVLLLKQL